MNKIFSRYPNMLYLIAAASVLLLATAAPVHVAQAASTMQESEKEMESHPYKTALVTRWGRDVSPENVWPEYPRPQMARESWQNLNGLWDYAVTPASDTNKPDHWNGAILVPFALESRLGGVQRLLQPEEALWYKRSFELAALTDKRTLLNFEAVDYRCEVWVNDTLVGGHQGGNTPFTLDITDTVKQGQNEILVRVEDETEAWQMRGKQVLEPKGIWYTRVSGIWQTVWLEQVGETYIEDIDISTDAANGVIRIAATVNGAAEASRLRVTVKDAAESVVAVEGDAAGLSIHLDSPKLWSPDAPHLYSLDIELLDAGRKAVDRVASYTGIRSVGKMRDADGHLRFTLNGDVIFHWGPLDQGWWPDGLHTPPSDTAMRYDIEFLKAAGFNMIRKHIKREPRRYYYHCDRLGMMVWQDQPSGGENPRWTFLNENPEDAEWPDEHHKQFMYELERMMDTLKNSPAIVVWVPFNEAWGQHRTMDVGKWVAERDPSRLVNIASGGNFWPVGDIADAHAYPEPKFPFDPARYTDFVKVVGEFGGHGFPVDGHLWNPDQKNWGYGKQLPKDLDEYQARYRKSLEGLNQLRQEGVAAGVYTQTTDVEVEINGLLTYDREVAKIPAEELAQIQKELLPELSGGAH